MLGRRNCYMVMTEKGLTCDAGEMRGEGDFHMPWGNDWNRGNDELKRECCRMNCHMVMEAKGLTCDVGEAREHHDWHMPFGSDWNKPEADIKRECCRRNCHGVMTDKGLDCPGESSMRGPEDWHAPWGQDWEKSDELLRGQCCTCGPSGCCFMHKTAKKDEWPTAEEEQPEDECERWERWEDGARRERMWEEKSCDEVRAEAKPGSGSPSGSGSESDSGSGSGSGSPSDAWWQPDDGCPAAFAALFARRSSAEHT